MPQSLRRLLTTALLFVAFPASAAEVSAQAERLANLRADVETLHDEIQAEKEDHRGRLRALEAQKVDLEVQLRRQELRLERLLDDELALQERIRKGSVGSEDVVSVVQEGIGGMRAYVRGSLPFKSEDRLAALAALDKQLEDGVLPPEQVATRLWAFAEDERRMGRENALGRQVAVIDGGNQLVEVARLGMVAMYWRGPDGAVGQVVREGQDWRWVVVDNAEAQGQIEAVFDALGRGIRVGWFSLPSPLAGMGESQ